MIHLTDWGDLKSSLRPRHSPKPLKRRNTISQLYELDTSTNTKELINADGDIDEFKFLGTVSSEAAKSIEDMVDIYDRSASGIFGSIFRHQGPYLAWAYILLDREYAVADAVRNTLADGSGIKFANYSVMSNPLYPNEKHSVGYLWIKEKSALAGLANASVLWAECWRVLANVGADKHCIAILDPLPKDWSYHNENSAVLNVWHESKVYNSRGGASDETH